MDNIDCNIFNMANALRILSADMVEKAKSGHPGMPLGMADVAYVLFRDFLDFNPHDPLWLNRDRFILSAGHGSALLYSLLYLTGYQQITLEELKNFRQAHSQTPGHPEHNPQAGIETTTGPLGQGVANAVGMALAAKILQSRYGDDVVNHKIYVICGDGCLMEGVTQEAISLAGHLKLDNLVLLFDDNAITIDGATDIATSEDHLMRFAAAGWQTQTINGHNQDEIFAALQSAKKAIKPIFIACRTQIGHGAPTKHGTAAAHGSPLGGAEISALREALAWPYMPFEIPAEVLRHFRAFHERVLPKYNAWQQNSHNVIDEFLNVQNVRVAIEELLRAKQEINPAGKLATRKASENVLNIIAPHLLNNLIGGSADLTSSNLTYAKAQKVISADDYNGSYVHYGVREHAMAAIMNGISLHSKFIPYGGTFLCFSDYARPAMRLAALMRQRVIYVMTHDSIGLGEDGPTHQPVEHLAALRAIPHLYVFRPADEVETFEAWELALCLEAPSVLALSRQAVTPIARHKLSAQNFVARGAYIVGVAAKAPQVTIFASGSEVGLAQQVGERLTAADIRVNLVSVPCMELFWEQDVDYVNTLLQNDSLKVVIEAGIAQPWGRFLGVDGLFFGVEDFGVSAPYEDVYKHFALDAENIFAKVTAKITTSA